MVDFDKLCKAAENNKIDSAELVMVFNARTTTMRAYNDRAGKQTGDDFTKAKTIYTETLQQLGDKYFPKQSKDPDREFKTQKAAREYICTQGYLVSVGKFSQDSHKFTTSKGVILLSELLDYARQSLRKNSPADQSGEGREEAETRKARADADRSEIKRDDERRELDKQWIKREEADLETCTWTALTRDGIVARFIKSLPSFIHAVGGDLDRLADGQAVFDQAVTDACNDISRSGEVEVDIEEG